MAFRRKIIQKAKVYKVNKSSYVKSGSKVAQSKIENQLYENMFEVVLNEDYED